MNSYLITGTVVVVFALIFYSIGVLSEQRSQLLLRRSLLFLTLGLLCDIMATALMITGSSKGLFTLHGFIGYSALLGMLVDNVLFWKMKKSVGYGATVSKGLHLFSRYAYLWWVVAFFSGMVLSMRR